MAWIKGRRTTRKPLNHYTMMCLRERTHKISGGSPSSKTGPVRNNLRPKVLILILGARNFKMRISPLKDSDFTDDNTLAASRKQSQLIKHPKNPNASFGWGKNRTKIIPNGFFLDLICSFSFFSKLVHHFSLAYFSLLGRICSHQLTGKSHSDSQMLGKLGDVYLVGAGSRRPFGMDPQVSYFFFPWILTDAFDLHLLLMRPSYPPQT